MEKRDIIVIGASAGGVEAVPLLLSSFKPNVGAAFFVTLHVPPNSESYMPHLIARQGQLPAEHAQDGMVIRPGRVYVAPPDYHLLLGPDVLQLSHGPKENRHRPAIDPLFRTAAKVYGARVAGVLLTGNLDDGVSGLHDIQQHGGLTIVQDPKEAPFPEMPRNALAAFEPDHCLKVKQIENLLINLPNSSFGGRKMKPKKRVKDSVQSLEAAAEITHNGRQVPFVCPECHGPLWELQDGKLLRYQCLVGHRYSIESLLSGHEEELEAALWIALRTLEERIKMYQRLVGQATRAGRGRGEQLFAARMAENQGYAKLIRGILERLKAEMNAPTRRLSEVLNGKY